ncbi:MAG: methyltransferase domain-containing protein [Desulfovibrio sp.]|jgi:tRNA1(Val) A37 N6-methylase TrmN6|nr:methyltransferase domain-containing protein [Desulfovibrio sp.]
MCNINNAAALAARAFFPRGLVQPPGAFRFSAEALFPAVYAGLRSGMRLLDLGTGCGVTAFTALCLNPAIQVVGVEILPEAAAAAALNAERLGFSRAFRVICADLADLTLFFPDAASDSTETDAAGNAPRRITARSFDAATANPPYRQRGRGRLPASAARRTALFEEPGTLDVFCAAAAEALKETGRLTLVYPAARLPDVTAALERVALRLVRILPLCPRTGTNAALLLLEAAPASSVPHIPPRFEAPLILHGADGRFTRAALQFCPFLACNA